MRLVLWVGILCGVNASAGSVTESFESTARKAASTLVWNTSLGRLHPTVWIENAVTNNIVPVTFDYNLDFGDGRHGVFDSTTYQNFDSNTATASVVDLNTDTYPALQVTNFRLPTGITIRPVGSNPLIIRSLQDVILETGSSIDCSGENGEATKQPNTLTSAGGTGHCGGGNGGAGGRFAGGVIAAEKGYPQSGATNPTGGDPGNVQAGGGGGGTTYDNSPSGTGWSSAGAAGATPGGSNLDDRIFARMIGSAGGGGGGVANGTGSDSTGSGGGAGGGAVFIFAYQDFNNQGSISVRGGTGGTATVGTLGGLGGGGGGGTVVLIAGRNYVNDGPVLSNPGSGATRAGNLGDGGTGAEARVWYTDSDGTLGGGTAEEKNNFLNDYKDTDYTLGTLEATTLAIDLANTRPNVDSINVSQTVQGGGSVTVSVAGSKDGFAGDDTGWQPISALSTVSKKRYVKFRVQINNANATLFSYVDAITINYSETTQNDFAFGPACGRIENPAAPTFWRFLFEILAMLVPYILIKIYQLIPKINFGKT